MLYTYIFMDVKNEDSVCNFGHVPKYLLRSMY